MSGLGFCLDTQVMQTCPSLGGVTRLGGNTGRKQALHVRVEAVPGALWEQRGGTGPGLL